MAQPQIQTRKETQNSIRDYNGNIILEIGQAQYTVRSNGELIHRSLNESIQLADGSLWSPLMLVQSPPIYIGICEQCRKRKLFRRSRNHGIVALHRAKLCSDCGELCCPKHSRKSKDNQWRCIPCNKKYKLANFLKPIFFQRKG